MAEGDFDDEFTGREGLITALIFIVALSVIIVTVILTSTSWEFPRLIPDWEWGFTEWSTLFLFVLISGIFVLAVVLGSDDEGEGNVFEETGFAYAIFAVVALIFLVQTNFLGLGGADAFAQSACPGCPEGYVDYGSEQPHGYGTWGPPDEGWLTDWQGAGAGCVGGAGLLLVLGQIPPLTILPEEVITMPIGCAIGAATGYGFSSGDFDGDPTTGW
jgi:hypothetical protein